MAHTIYVGAYSSVITTLSFDSSASPPTLRVTGTTDAGSNPSWIATHPTDKSLLFASNEVDEGKILMYKRHTDGRLELLQTVWSGGAGTAHFAVGEKEVVTGNYSSGTLQTIPLMVSPPLLLAPDSEPVRFEFPGTGPDAERQEASHPHQVVILPSGKQVLVPDLGSDRIWVLERKGGECGSWTVKTQVKTKAGHGPRHLVVKDDAMYVLNELENTVSAYVFPASEVKETACLPTLTPPAVAAKGMLGAELMLTEDGVMYASNRNDPDEDGDSIAIYTTTDGFSLVNEVRTGLKHVRAVAAFDGYLVAGGLNGGGIKVFQRTEGGLNLSPVAHLEAGAVDKPTSFVVY